jgi:formylmethanofuran dehydrogenase subunit E
MRRTSARRAPDNARAAETRDRGSTLQETRCKKEDRKRLITFVEIDRCPTDAVAVVTGCRPGKRALKFRDWGKVAATFVDLRSGRAIRVAAKESSKALARKMHPEIADKNQQQMLAYREMTDDDLFTAQW